jgi:hypothetical protein
MRELSIEERAMRMAAMGGIISNSWGAFQAASMTMMLVAGLGSSYAASSARPLEGAQPSLCFG